MNQQNAVGVPGVVDTNGMANSEPPNWSRALVDIGRIIFIIRKPFQ